MWAKVTTGEAKREAAPVKYGPIPTISTVAPLERWLKRSIPDDGMELPPYFSDRTTTTQMFDRYYREGDIDLQNSDRGVVRMLEALHQTSPEDIYADRYTWYLNRRVEWFDRSESGSKKNILISPRTHHYEVAFLWKVLADEAAKYDRPDIRFLSPTMKPEFYRFCYNRSIRKPNEPHDTKCGPYPPLPAFQRVQMTHDEFVDRWKEWEKDDTSLEQKTQRLWKVVTDFACSENVHVLGLLGDSRNYLDFSTIVARFSPQWRRHTYRQILLNNFLELKGEMKAANEESNPEEVDADADSKMDNDLDSDGSWEDTVDNWGEPIRRRKLATYPDHPVTNGQWTWGCLLNE